MIKEMIGAVGGALIMTLAIQYVIYGFVNQNESLNVKRYLCICFLQSFVTIGTYYIDDGILRIIFLYIFVTIFSYILFRKNTVTTLLSTFATYILIIISELIFSFFVVFLLKIDLEKFKEQFFLDFITNFFISLNLLIISNIRPLKCFLRDLIENANKRITYKVLLISVTTLITIELMVYYIYFEVGPVFTLLINLILIFVYISLTIMFFKENNDKEKIKSRYDSIINNSERYERIISQLHMTNHENKNNLIVLKGMLNSSNGTVKEYIDDLINDNRKDDNDLLLKTSSIPTGGLQGLIYQKLLDMKDKSIDYHLEVSKDINKKKIENIDVKTNKNLCTIVGVFLDNAIQAVENIENKNIGIYLYQEKNIFVISISNTYEGKIDLENMYSKGYTTKKEGHGYGLSVVQEILDKNKIFHNEKAICGNVFIQKIKLNLEKK